MNYITEKYAVVNALVPQSIDAAGTATGAFADMATRNQFCFAIQLGAVAAGKSVKVELLSSAKADGTGPVVKGEVTYTAPTGGATSHIVHVVGRVSEELGRYLAVKVTNSGAAAVLAAATLVGDNAYYPEDTGATTLVV